MPSTETHKTASDVGRMTSFCPFPPLLMLFVPFGASGINNMPPVIMFFRGFAEETQPLPVQLMWTLVSLVVSSLICYDVSYFSQGCLFSEILRIPNWKLKCKQYVQKRHFHALALLQILNFFKLAFDGCRVFHLMSYWAIRYHRALTELSQIHIEQQIRVCYSTCGSGFWGEVSDFQIWTLLDSWIGAVSFLKGTTKFIEVQKQLERERSPM